MTEERCDTCAHKAGETEADDGGRMVDCDANELQMYSPYADGCVHWEAADDEG